MFVPRVVQFYFIRINGIQSIVLHATSGRNPNADAAPKTMQNRSNVTFNAGTDQRGLLMTDESEPVIPSKEELIEAQRLICDCLKLNKVPVSLGISACLSVIMRTFEAKKVSKETILAYLISFERCVKEANGTVTIIDQGL